MLQNAFADVARPGELKHLPWPDRPFRGSVKTLRRAIASIRPKAALKKPELGELVNELALIWEDVQGRFPGRVYDAYHNADRGPFYRFVDACLRAIDPGARDDEKVVPVGFIRKVIRGRRLVERKRQKRRGSR